MFNVPIEWQLVLLTLLGAIIGTQVNRAIYAWCWFLRRSYSPWSRPSESEDPRRLVDFVPIVGWWFLRRNASLHGRAFWFRPLVIELLCATGLPLLRWWYFQGGPFPEAVLTAEHQLPDGFQTWGTVLFAIHAVLIFLMLIATMIDFDEKTIPDQVTLPGTLLAFGLAALAVPMALPTVRWEPSTTAFGKTEQVPPYERLSIGDRSYGRNNSERSTSERSTSERSGQGSDESVEQSDAETAGVTDGIEPLIFASPQSDRMAEADYWLNRPIGFLICSFMMVVWTWALVPKTITLRHGWSKGLEYLFASLLQTARAKQSKSKLPPRKMPWLTKFMIVLTPIMIGLIYWSWSQQGDSWTSLSSSLLGFALGGGLVWAIRIVATYALGQEAMGFGDVTLMGMLGAFLGWQPALLIFAFAPFTAIVIALGEFVLTRRHEIAFGPYLCLSAVIVILGWDPIWNDWAAPKIFVLSDLLIQVVVVGVVLMGVMLMVWGAIKRNLGWMPA